MSLDVNTSRLGSYRPILMAVGAVSFSCASAVLYLTSAPDEVLLRSSATNRTVESLRGVLRVRRLHDSIVLSLK